MHRLNDCSNDWFTAWTEWVMEHQWFDVRIRPNFMHSKLPEFSTNIYIESRINLLCIVFIEYDNKVDEGLPSKLNYSPIRCSTTHTHTSAFNRFIKLCTFVLPWKAWRWHWQLYEAMLLLELDLMTSCWIWRTYRLNLFK